MITVKRAGNGSLEVTATEAIAENTAYHAIADFVPLTCSTYQTVQLDERRHILERYLGAINHSCDPNTIINTSEMRLLATRNIKKNEAITFFYPSTEWELSSPFRCRCLSPRCIGMVLGGRYLTEEMASRHFVNGHIRRLRAAESKAIREAVGSVGKLIGSKVGSR